VKVDIRKIDRGEAEYPGVFEELSKPPASVWVAGALLGRPAVGIVGTRRADAEGIAFAERLACELSERGASIVSGGALGIDAAAHRGALARTLVVHAGPLESPYPVSHRTLFLEILACGGGWISESAPGTPTHRWRFLARNRLIAALADVVVVVQAPLRSGALSTAAWARSLKRPVFAVPAAPWDPRGDGVLALLAGGACPCTSAADIADALALRPCEKETRREAPLGAEAQRVLDALSSTPSHVDAISHATGLSAARAIVALVELARAGRARQENGLWRASRSS
jgi:DNA processing protein